MPRVHRDIEDCLKFIEGYLWGKRQDRARDIRHAFRHIRERPLMNCVEARRRSAGVELRRCNVRQFAIIYAFFQPSARFPRGLVSIRAVRHWRVKNVFTGVKEPTTRYGSAGLLER